MILNKKTILPYLAQKNFISWQAGEEDIQIQEGKSKNFNFLVQILGGTSYFLKQSKSNQPFEVSVFEREAIFYSWVGYEMAFAEARLFLPPFYGYDPNHHILLFGLLENTKNLAKYLNTKPFTLKLAENIGIIFKKFNQIALPSNIPLPKATSYPFFEIDNPHFRTELGKRNQLAQTLAESINENSVLLPAIKKAAKLWQVNGLLHKDIKFENWLIKPQTQQLYLIDWEDASHGDTDWDLACMLRSIILHTLLKDKVILIPGLTPLNPISDNQLLVNQIQAFLKGYGHTFEVSHQKKIILFIAVAILQKMVEFAQAGSDMGTRNTQMIRIAEDMAVNGKTYYSTFFVILNESAVELEK